MSLSTPHAGKAMRDELAVELESRIPSVNVGLGKWKVPLDLRFQGDYSKVEEESRSPKETTKTWGAEASVGVPGGDLTHRLESVSGRTPQSQTDFNRHNVRYDLRFGNSPNRNTRQGPNNKYHRN